MKTILLFFLGLFLSLSVFSQNPNAIFIGQSTLGGIRNNNNIIATTEKSYFEAVQSKKLRNRNVSKCLISKESISLISRFIINNCNASDLSNENTGDKVIITIYSNDLTTNCFIIDREKIKNYFNQLHIVVKGFRNKKDKNNIESLIEGIMNVLNYDLNKAKHM